MVSEKIQIVEKILDANDQVAAINRSKLDNLQVFSINIMASPGAGKTSLILQTIKALKPKIRIAVIEGDTAPVTIDAKKIMSEGIPAVQINTGGDCHLDSVMLSRGLENLKLTEVDLLIVENVGNLVCPAAFQLGTHCNVLIASIPEGDDKPYKYPNIYRNLQAVIVNKIDLLPYIQFDMDYFEQGVKMLNPGVDIIKVSCQTSAGIPEWIDWLIGKINPSNER